MNMNSLSTLLASVTAGVAGTLVYHFVLNKFNEKGTDPGTVTLHVEIPQETVAYLIGRDGTNIKRIENNTNTCISFIDQGGPYRLCVVRGRREDVESANEELQTSVKEFAQLETAEIFVSDKTISRLTADGNLKLTEITISCNARIYIYKVPNKPNSLLVRGVYHQIELVRARLKQIALEEEQKEEKRLSVSPLSPYTHQTPTKRAQLGVVPDNTEKLEATSADGYSEVFVASVRNPFCFYVQIVGPQSVELDRFIEKMTDVYMEESFRQQLGTPTLEVGAFAAAFSHEDKCWYRARIISIEMNEEDEVESELRMEFLDFGDTSTIRLRDLSKLHPDFLSMKFQAIECRLSGITPSNGEEWSEVEIDTFETLTHCAQWKVLMARVEYYHERQSVDGSFIPFIKLVDTNNEKVSIHIMITF